MNQNISLATSIQPPRIRVGANYKTNAVSRINLHRNTKIGFIILRHVNSSATNLYWQNCYDCIRRFYPENSILIIDDNSIQSCITSKECYKTTVIQSEFHGRGELLPYYYYIKNKLFDTAVIIHDSVFIQKYIDFQVQSVQFIWDFEHDWDQIEDETRMIRMFKDKELMDLYMNKSLWKGCFGGMSIITHDFLSMVNQRYNLSILLDAVLTRYNRCSFERVFSCICQVMNPRLNASLNARLPYAFSMNTRLHNYTTNAKQELSLLGTIHKYIPWNTKISEKNKYAHLPLLKVWTGR